MRKAFNYKVILIIVLAVLVIIALSNTETIHSFVNQETLREIIAPFGIFAPVTFIIIYIVFNVLCIPAAPLIVLGGALFGIMNGIIYVWIGALLGSMCAFIISRFLARKSIRIFLKDRSKHISVFDAELQRRGFVTTALLRLLPVSPFTIVNYILGLSNVSFKDYVSGTAIGIIPGTIVYTYFLNSFISGQQSRIVFGSCMLIAWISILYVLRVRYYKTSTVSSPN